MPNPVQPQHDAPLRIAGTAPGAIDRILVVTPAELVPHRAGRLRIAAGTSIGISGWALDPLADVSVRRVAIVVDGVRTCDAESGLPRPDVPRAHAPRAEVHVGFRATVAMQPLRPGLHELRVRALASDAQWYDVARLPFSVSGALAAERGDPARDVAVHVDGVTGRSDEGAPDPLAGVVPLGHDALVRGWAVDEAPRAPPPGICVDDGAGGYWTAICDVPRGDVSRRGASPAAVFGFEVPLPTGALEPGPHRIRVWALDEHQRRAGTPAEATFHVAAPMRPFPAFARPSHARVRASALVTVDGDEPVRVPAHGSIGVRPGDTIAFEGWADVADAPRANAVVIELWNRAEMPPMRFLATSGYERPEPPAGLHPAPRRDAWFFHTMTLPALARGAWQVVLVVVDGDDASAARAPLCTLDVGDATARRPISSRPRG